MIYSKITELIGNTPLVELTNLGKRRKSRRKSYRKSGIL